MCYVVSIWHGDPEFVDLTRPLWLSSPLVVSPVVVVQVVSPSSSPSCPSVSPPSVFVVVVVVGVEILISDAAVLVIFLAIRDRQCPLPRSTPP